MNPKDMEKSVRKNILSLTPYSTARDECGMDAEVYLDANENPYDNGFNRYPDPHQKLLKRKISEKKGIPEDMIFIGNGSDEAIDLVFRIFCRPGIDNAVSIAPTYGMYKVAAAINDVEFREVPLRDDFSLDCRTLTDAADSNTRLMFICSPNNPTGNSFPMEEILKIAGSFDGIVVLDEAYIDFSSLPSLAPMTASVQNLIVLQTFSKAWGMAGLRVGMAFAAPWIIRLMSNIKYPYNINSITQKIVMQRLGEDPGQAITAIRKERERISSAIQDCPGVIRVYPSDANFILVKFVDPDATFRKLTGCGIIVRDRSRVAGCEGCLRITVGTPSENELLIDVLRGGKSQSVSPGKAACRNSSVFRATSETAVTAMVGLDGKGPSFISTGIGFFDHMLDQIVHHAGISLLVYAEGDTEVDEHHTVEDVAIVLGKAVSQALGDKVGIGRYGFTLPMDESEATVLMDLGGRIDFRWNATFRREKIGDMPTEMFSHFFKSFAETAGCNLHITAEGENEHHKIEGIFKAFARALKMAVAKGDGASLPSSKGIL